MKANIYLDKDKLKNKEKSKHVNIPLPPRESQPWEEPNENGMDVWRIYQIMQNNEDTIKQNINGEIHLGSPMSIGHNSDSKLYNWKIENYESQAHKY